MTATDDLTAVRQRSRGHTVAAICLGLTWTLATAFTAWSDPMTFAFAGLLGITALLPLTIRALDYAAAVAIVALAVAIDAGLGAATVVAAVAFALWGSVAMLTSIRVDRRFATMVAIVASLALLTWPIWAANLLLRFDVQPLVDQAVRFGPLFAVNRTIDPTDAFTHRPWSYRWMNLGQDVPYAMPATIWPCLGLHGAMGVAGLLCMRMRRRLSHASPRNRPRMGATELG